MTTQDFRTIDDALGHLDPGGSLARLGASVAARTSIADFDDAVSALSAPMPGLSNPVGPALVEATALESEGTESLADLFDDVGGGSPESRPISFSAPAASFLDSPSDAASIASLEDLLEAPAESEPVTIETAEDSVSESTAESDEPEIEIEEDEFAALDSLEIVVDD